MLKPRTALLIAWLLFALIVLVLVIGGALAQGASSVTLRCEANACVISIDDVNAIIDYVRRLESMLGKSCT
jgi:hypothetical protein